MDSSSISQTEKKLKAADKMADAVSEFYIRYMRGEDTRKELNEMKLAQIDYWSTGTETPKPTEPNFSRENED